jgi:glycosyltransferase involved in cell wall biosynthesis
VIPRGGDELAHPAPPGLVGFRPDVIVAYDADSPAAFKGARAAGRLGVPLVVVEEGFPDRGRPLGRLLRAIGARLWGGYVRRRVARALALDRAARTQLLDRGFEPERVEQIPAGVDLTRYRPGLTSPLPGIHGVRGRILLHVADALSEEGAGPLLRAYSATVARSAGWALVLAGGGPGRPGLRALADRLGIGAQVHWLPSLRREELPGLLGSSTLLLATGDPNDVTGWRVRRALACGLPVIASRDSRHGAIIEQDGCGLLVEGDDAEAWTEALRLATVSPQRRRRWSRRARELAVESYAWPRVAERIEFVLREATHEGAAGNSRGTASPSATSPSATPPSPTPPSPTPQSPS